jgi:ABC-type multidrug transport system permease subunit
LFAVLLLIAGCATGAALGWAVFSVRAVVLATLLFLMIAIIGGLDYNLSGWTITVLLIVSIALLETSYVIIVILCGELKQTDLSARTPVNSQTWTLMRSGGD